jgi:hypothetical protein
MLKTQNCSVCPHVQKCWALLTNKGNPISTQNVIVNILVCRLQLGIDRDRTTTNLLQIFRPGMINLLTHAKKSGAAKGMDLDQLLLDMQSTAIEYLMNDYKIGDRGRATPYLFDIHQGFLTKWVKWVTSKHRRFYAHHELYSPIDLGDDDKESPYIHSGIERASPEGGWHAIMEGGDSTKYDPYVETEAASNHLSQEVGEIIEDGKTLTSNEYRVIKFCLANGNELNSTRHIDGLHIYLAQLMHVSRPRITRLYKRAKEKIKKRHLALEQSDG